MNHKQSALNILKLDAHPQELFAVSELLKACNTETLLQNNDGCIDPVFRNLGSLIERLSCDVCDTITALQHHVENIPEAGQRLPG